MSDTVRTTRLVGRYLGGHPARIKGLSVSTLRLDADGVHIGGSFKSLFSVPWEEVRALHADGESELEHRVTATRLLALGIFAFAAKKEKRHEYAFVTVEADEWIFAFELKDTNPVRLQAKLAPYRGLITRRS